MKCSCGAQSYTVDTRSVYGGEIIRRRRVCMNGHRFTTRETYAEVWRGERPSPMEFYPLTETEDE